MSLIFFQLLDHDNLIWIRFPLKSRVYFHSGYASVIADMLLGYKKEEEEDYQKFCPELNFHLYVFPGDGTSVILKLDKQKCHSFISLHQEAKNVIE